MTPKTPRTAVFLNDKRTNVIYLDVCREHGLASGGLNRGNISAIEEMKNAGVDTFDFNEL